MRFTTHAEVLTPDHPMWQPYANGSTTTPPGRILSDVLNETAGRYEMTIDLPERFMVDVREAAVGSTEATLIDVAQSGRIWISFEHLRGLDPKTTRITLGCSLGLAD